MKAVVALLLLVPVLVWAENAIERKKSATIKTMIEACSSSMLEPNVHQFMERAKAAGRPFPDEESAKRAIEQKRKEIATDPSFKRIRIAADVTCQCALEHTISKIKSAKTQSDLDNVIRNANHDPTKTEECANKYLGPAFK